MRGITLIGMPGAGKSTIGKKLAQRLNWKFLDLDIFLQEKTGKSPAEIISKIGSPGFIQLEAVAALGLNFGQTVFAPGGSIIYSPMAMEKIKFETRIFYLELPLAEIKKRLGDNPETRGIIGLSEKGLEKLFEERTALYQSFADRTISCLNKTEAEILQEIIDIGNPGI